MPIIAQQQTEQVSNEYFELFEVVPMEDADGNTVNVKQSIGQYSKAQLEQQKTNLQNSITEIEEKIAAINALS